MNRSDIDSLEVFKMSMSFGDQIWDSVIQWDDFSKKAFGYQLVRSADSIAANISEGYGRYFFKENRQFCYIARGSLYEAKTWVIKAEKRNLIPKDTSIILLLNELEMLLKKLNAYINYIEKHIKK
ncbi:MAG: four helix bundle protein [Bacteroidetes bacterium]|nr:four helix bundle protein [Bacteroidota bacterium]